MFHHIKKINKWSERNQHGWKEGLSLLLWEGRKLWLCRTSQLESASGKPSPCDLLIHCLLGPRGLQRLWGNQGPRCLGEGKINAGPTLWHWELSRALAGSRWSFAAMFYNSVLNVIRSIFCCWFSFSLLPVSFSLLLSLTLHHPQLSPMGSDPALLEVTGVWSPEIHERGAMWAGYHLSVSASINVSSEGRWKEHGLWYLKDAGVSSSSTVTGCATRGRSLHFAESPESRL